MINQLLELERALADIRASPETLDVRMNELMQQYETVLTLLESQVLGALLSRDWSEFDRFIDDFRTPCTLTQTTITEGVDDEFHPRIRALARETSQKIKTLTNAHNTELKAIYQEFRSQADAIKAEASTADMDSPGADSLPTDQTER